MAGFGEWDRQVLHSPSLEEKCRLMPSIEMIQNIR
jgi:hypothetical protein